MIVVVGSLNLDLVVRVPRLPAEGETALAGSYAEHHGGKGANQAVAAARAGGDVTMVGRVGRDAAGPRLRSSLASEGVDVRHVTTSDEPTGRALIEVDDAGANRIVVVPGANGDWNGGDVPSDAITAAELLVLQREVPDEVVAAAVRHAHAAGVPVLLNAAPADGFDAGLLGSNDRLIVNAHEAASLLGGDPERPGDPEVAAATLARRGPGDVVITLGADGALAAGRSGTVRVAGFPVRPVDTTGAGDAFAAAFAVAWSERASLGAALRFACAAGAEATLQPGAQPSLPSRAAIEARLRGSTV
jgi:ribokinase